MQVATLTNVSDNDINFILYIYEKDVGFGEPHYQVIFTFLIVVGQLLIVVASIGYRFPQVSKVFRKNSDDSNDFPVNVLFLCVRSFGFLGSFYRALI